MWLVTQHGFFNIIQYDEDEPEDILTIKARRRVDLESLKATLMIFNEWDDLIDGIKAEDRYTIETSDAADYRYRMKVRRKDVVELVKDMVDNIDYPKFKGRIMALPEQRDRHDIYLQVWDQLHLLQETEHGTG